jgi:hypothetical protein
MKPLLGELRRMMMKEGFSEGQFMKKRGERNQEGRKVKFDS